MQQHKTYRSSEINPKRRLVTVFGLNSVQGSHVAESLLKESNFWIVRGACRNVNSPIAKAFAARGVEVVHVDYNTPATIARAVDGAYAVFAVTFPEFLGIRLSEYAQGRLIADSARRAGVQTFIFSSLPNVKKESNGMFEARNFTEKALVEDYVKSLGFKYTAFPMLAFYYQNFMAHYAPIFESEELTFVLPAVNRLSAVDARVIGPCVANILHDPETWNGLEIPLVGENKPLSEFVQDFNQITGQRATFRLIPLGQLSRAGPFHAATASMFGWISEFGYFGNRDLTRGSRICGSMNSWPQFLSETGWRGEVLRPVDSLNRNTNVVSSKQTTLVQPSMQTTDPRLEGPHSEQLHETALLSHQGPIVVVFGATGAQGYSILDALSRFGNYRLRGVCRDLTSEAAKYLISRHVELFAVDLNTIDSLALDRVFEGNPSVCFAMTIPAYAGSRSSEYKQGIAIADAAKRHGVKTFIWSDLPNVKEESNGRYNAVHFSDKALVSKYARSLGFEYFFSIMPGMYFQNWLTPAYAPVYEDQNQLTFHIPAVPLMSLFDVRDVGLVVHELLNNPERWNGFQIPLCGDYITPHDFVATFNKVTGKNARLNLIPLEELQKQKTERSKALVSQWGWIRDFGYFGKRDRTLGNKLISLRTWEDFLKQTGFDGEPLSRDIDQEFQIPQNTLSAPYGYTGTGVRQINPEKAKKLVVVFGSGAQGSSIIESLSHDPRFSLRVITKNINEPNARAFYDRGYDVHAIDVNKGSFGNVFENAYAVVASVPDDFLEVGEGVKSEFERVKLIADAAKKAGVSHFIFLGIPDTIRNTTTLVEQQNLKSKQKKKNSQKMEEDQPRFIRDYISKANFKYFTMLYPSLYFQNFEVDLAPGRIKNEWVWTLPDVPFIPAFDVRQTGGCVKTVLEHPMQFNSLCIPLIGTRQAPLAYVEDFERITQQGSQFHALPLESFVSRNASGAVIAELIRTVSFYDAKDALTVQKVLPHLLTWEEYLKETKWHGQQMEFGYVSGQCSEIVVPMQSSSLGKHTSHHHEAHHYNRTSRAIAPLLVVFGATGNQGSSIIDEVLKERKFRVRAIVRNAQSEKACALTIKGVEVVEADLDDPMTLPPAVEGAIAVFGLTIPFGAETSELDQGKALVDACRSAGVQHFIYGTLPNVKEISSGEFNVPHFTDKALVEDYARKNGNFKFLSFPSPAFYFQNFLSLFPPKKNGDEYVFRFPNTKNLTAVSIRDFGKVVVYMLNSPGKYDRQIVPVAAENSSPEQLIKIFGKAFEVRTRLETISHEEMMQSNQVEFAQMFAYFNKFSFYPSSINWKTGSKIAKLRSWEEFVREQGLQGFLKEQNYESANNQKQENIVE